MKCIASHYTMAHSLAPRLPAASISTSPKRNAHLPSCLCFHKVLSCQQTSAEGLGQKLVTRRSVALGLGGAALGLKAGEGSANAAARRPPPPPVEEKKDPNVSGVTAKVLASKRRKEAMKESMAKLRERGKPVVQIQEPSSE
nr:Zinc transporter like [Ipomoea batatas]